MGKKLIELSKSLKPKYKMVARFETDDGQIKSVHFGARGMFDYPKYYKEEGAEVAENKKKLTLPVMNRTKTGTTL